MTAEPIVAAELALLDQHLVIITVTEWNKFEAWAHSPAQSVPGLRDLAATRPAWQD